MQYWLVKSEPSCYSIEDLKKDKTTQWNDVRSYQARNFIRAMKKGDWLLFYHSSCAVPGIVGLAKVNKEAYPDPTQFDPKNEGYEKASTQESPRWSTMDAKFVEVFKESLTLAELKNDSAFAGMVVTQQGSRLSVQPVSEKHFKRVLALRSTKK
jgi:predicted RNA-binding protein with PUA-like domain